MATNNIDIAFIVGDVLKEWAQSKVDKAKTILQKKEAYTQTRQLMQSIQPTEVLITQNTVSIQIWMEDYGKFIDQGVRGIGFNNLRTKDGREVSKTLFSTKAFGVQRSALSSGVYKFRTPFVGRKMLESIKDYIRDKPIVLESTNNKSKTIPRAESLMWAIAKNIKRTGIGATYFFSDSFNAEAYDELARMIEDKLGGGYEIQFGEI